MNTIMVTLFLSCLEQGIVLGELSTQSGVTVINAEVTGGLPPPNYFLWSDHLDNGTRSAYRPGEGRSSIVVSAVSALSIIATCSKFAIFPFMVKRRLKILMQSQYYDIVVGILWNK